MKRILFYFGHPAHYHLFKNTIKQLSKEGCQYEVLIKKKDILEDLLKSSNLEYKNIQPNGRRDSKLGIAVGLLKRDLKIFWHCLKRRPDIMVGSSTEIAHIGFLLRIPSIVLSEDDYNVVPLFSGLGYPFANAILSPESCNNGRWEHKSYKYSGFHKLAYLHENYFIPNKELIKNIVDISKPYYLLRFAKLTAHHDSGKKGINAQIASKLIDILSKTGNVYITSERILEPEFEKYRLKIDPLIIHHVLYFAKLYIGDSQSMAVEAALLGTPGIRFNDFAGEIGVLEELEKKYFLTKGIKTKDVDELFDTVVNYLREDNISETYKLRRKKLLSEKIDVTAFLTWFIMNYPNSKQIMRENSEYQSSFK